MGERALICHVKLPKAIAVLAIMALVIMATPIPPERDVLAIGPQPEQSVEMTISGAVTDMVTGERIPKAEVSLTELGKTIKAGSDGSLPATTLSLPAGTERLKLKIDAEGYQGESSDARVFPGAKLIITSRLVSKGYPTKVAIRDFTALDFTAQATSASYIPSTIRVYRVNLGRVDVVDFNFYCKHVLPSEWIGSWPAESLKAGAMGVKTYAWYWISQGGKWPSLGADVKDTTADQVYDPNYSYYATDQAVDDTWSYRMTRNGMLFQSHYCAGTYDPGYYPGYEGWMTQWGTKYWADQGKDWQWMLHYYYDPYGAISIYSGVPGKRAVSDFDGNGLSDGLAVYDYGNGSMALWVFGSTGAKLMPSVWWSTSPGTFDPSHATWVSGDFDGDGKTDVAALYNYGGSTTGLWFFKSTGNRFDAPRLMFMSGSWNAGSTKLAAGNFDSGDTAEELLAFYDYGGGTTGILLFNGLSKAPYIISVRNNWDWGNTRLLAGNVDDAGGVDLIAVYRYSGSSTGIWTFPFSSGGAIQNPKLLYFSPLWSADSARYLAGDVNGDSKSDIIAPYSYGGTSTGIWVFTSTGTSLIPNQVYYTPYWDINRSTFLPGDITGDDRADILGIYDWGGGTIAAWLFPSARGTLGPPLTIYGSNAWNNANAIWITPY